MIDRQVEKAVTSLVREVFGSRFVKKATVYVSPTFTVKMTNRHRFPSRTAQDVVLTLGRPNYAEREFIKKACKAGEPFPVRKVQLKFYPKKLRGQR